MAATGRRRARAVYDALPASARQAVHGVRRRARQRPRRGIVPRRIRVSVVVATYNSPAEGLQRLLDSIDAQTMPARAIELVFVDDGSTDDTYERLQRIAARRPNVVVRTIPNSGWASRPRNVGIELARGEYLLFMDHDDELLPTALDRAWRYGRDHRADVVNAKEVRTSGWSWGWDSFVEDVPHAQYVDPNPLIPMTPHKLYRRRFLLEHGIRFPDGARVLWEDIYFNTLAYARGARVAVLSSVPFYHWVIGAQNTSKTFGRDPEELWRNLALILDYIDTQLADRPEARDALVMHQVRGRVLNFVGPGSLRRPPEQYAIAYRHARELVARYAPADRDGTLNAVERCRIELVRRGDADLQRRLAEQDRAVGAVPVLDDVTWDGAELVLTVSTVLAGDDGEPLRLRRAGERWLRPLPDELAAVLSPEAVDVTDQLHRAAFTLSVKGRSSRSTWALPGTGAVSCDDDGVVRARVTARFDPVRFAREHDLTDPVWDFAARLAVGGHVVHRGLRGGRALPALLAGTAAVGYVNKDGLYSLDVAAAVRTVTGSGGATPDDVHVDAVRTRGGTRTVLSVPLPAVHCHGTTRLDGEVLLGDTRVPAQLRADGSGAVVRATAVLADGRYPLRARFLGRTGDTGVSVLVTDGAARAVATAPATDAPA